MRWNHFRNFEAMYLVNPESGTVIEVGMVYLQTGNESRAVGQRGIMYDRTRSGKIGPNFEVP